MNGIGWELCPGSGASETPILCVAGGVTPGAEVTSGLSACVQWVGHVQRLLGRPGGDAREPGTRRHTNPGALDCWSCSWEL